MTCLDPDCVLIEDSPLFPPLIPFPAGGGVVFNPGGSIPFPGFTGTLPPTDLRALYGAFASAPGPAPPFAGRQGFLPPPTVAAPPPIAAPKPPGEAASLPFGPIGAAVAPFAFALGPPPPAPLMTGEELFQELLGQGEFTPGEAPSLFEELVTKPPSLFQQLLGKADFTPKDPLALRSAAVDELTTAELSSGIGGALVRLFGNVAALLTFSPDLGPSAAQEAAIVAQELTSGDLPPPTIPGPPGLPESALVGFPPIPETVVVSAPRIAPVVLADPSLGFNPLLLGIGDLPSFGTQAAPGRQPRGQNLLGQVPQPARQPATAALGELAPTPRGGTRTRPLEATAPQPKPALQTLNECQPQQKKTRKKKKPRTICYRGTYEDRKSGLLKHPRERIECQ